MVDAERQMPGHVKAAYRDAVDNILFLKRQKGTSKNCSHWRSLTAPE